MLSASVLNVLDRATRVLVEDGGLQVQFFPTFKWKVYEDKIDRKSPDRKKTGRNNKPDGLFPDIDGDYDSRAKQQSEHDIAFRESKRKRVPSGGRLLGTYTILYNNAHTPYQGWPGTWPEGGAYSKDATLEVSKYENTEKTFHVFTANGDKYYTTEDFTIAQNQRWQIYEVVSSRIWFMIDGKKIAFDKSEPPAP